MPLMQDISRLLSDVYRAFQAYAEPVASHALQVYQSFLATAPGCIWLDHTRRQVITLRLVSYRASDWSSVVKVVEGHTNDVNSIFYSPDGALIVSGSKDNTVRVWDAYTGKQLAVIEHHTDRMESVAFSPDEAQIVLGSDDQMIRVWDPHTGKQLAVLQGDMGVALFVSFSPDGKRITAKDEEGDRLTWNILSVLVHEQFQIRIVAHTLSDSRELTSVKEPITHLPLEAHIWYSESGWIMLSQRSRTHSVRLCWLPNERRGSSFASHNMTAAIGARSGAVTILDFSETIAMLDKVL
jgi:WD40 repeat protein